MALDWIKMRTDLYRDPKVCMIADHLMDVGGELARYVGQNCQRQMSVTRNVMRNVTVGALLTLWGVLRHTGKRDNDDLVVRGATLSVIDDITDLPGFGSAMKSVGWAIEIEKGIVFPRFFEEYNVEPSENEKQKNAERQRRYREKRNALRNVTVTSRSNTEKRREEKSIREREKGENQNINLSDSMNAAWTKWKLHSMEKGKTVNEISEESQLLKLAQAYPDEADRVAAIEHAIEKNWANVNLSGDHRRKDTTVHSNGSGKRQSHSQKLFHEIFRKNKEVQSESS